MTSANQHESAIGIPMSPSSWTSLPPLQVDRAPVRVSWVKQQIPNGCLFYMWECYSPYIPCYSLHTSHPFLPSTPNCVHKSVLCVCVSIAAAAAKSLQSCLTLCDPIDGSPPGSPVPGILQARTLQWVAISFSNVWKWKVKVNSLSPVWLSATPWTAAYQAPPSMGFSSQEYWSGSPVPSVKWLQPLYITLQQFLKRTSLQFSVNPQIPLLHQYPKSYEYSHACTQVLRAPLFRRAQRWKL